MASFRVGDETVARIIPCLDIFNGRVVKGINFVNLTDAGDPLEQAMIYDKASADEICILDISASIESRAPLLDSISKIASKVFLPITVGGGITQLSDVQNLLMAGADKVAINSAAISNPNLISQISEKYGAQALVVAIDAKKNFDDNYIIYSHSGKQRVDMDAIAWAHRAQELGAGEILLTSIDADGTKSGYNLDLIRRVNEKLTIPLIASGGVGEVKDFEEGLLAGADALLAASVFHYNLLSIAEVKSHLIQNNFNIRPFISCD